MVESFRNARNIQVYRNYRTICPQWWVGYTGFAMFMSLFGFWNITDALLRLFLWFVRGTYSKPCYRPWKLTTKAPGKWLQRERLFLGGGFIFFNFHPYLGKISNLTNIFQWGWNHQLDFPLRIFRRWQFQGVPPFQDTKSRDGKHPGSMGFSGTPKDMGPPYGKQDPYYSHIFRDLDMGMGFPLTIGGVPCPWGSLKIPLAGCNLFSSW